MIAPFDMEFTESGYQIFRDGLSREEIAEAKGVIDGLWESLAPGHRLWDHVVPLSVLSDQRNPGITDAALLARTPFLIGAGEIAAIHSKVVHGGGTNRSQRERNLLVIQFGVPTDDYLHKADERYFGLDREEILNHP